VTSVYTPAGTADTEIANYYDELGRLAKVEAKQLNSEPASDITEYTYNAVGSLASVTYDNGNVAEYTYDAVNRLTNLTNWQSSAKVTPLSSYTYELSPDGQRTQATEVAEGAETVINWEYDDLNRLIREDYNAPGDANDYKHEYVQDLVGNRLKRNVVGDDPNTEYSYNDNDQLQWETTDGNSITYGYDDNGALVLRDSNDGDDVTYAYDLRGRLAQADIENGPTVGYLYNPDGMRVRATVDTDDIDYIIDPYNHTGYAQVLKEINGVTGSNRAYITGLDVVAQATGSSPPKYLLYDGHGSVRQLANNVGNVVANYDYDAYGKALNFNPAQAATQLLYAGEMIDPQTGLYNNRSRWYDASVGRFNRLDDFAGSRSDPQSLHKYAYGHCNPVTYSDPSGEFSLTEFVSVNTIIAVLIGALAPALMVGYSKAKAGASIAEIIRCAALTWAGAVGIGIGLALAGPSLMAAAVWAVSLIPGVSAGMAAAAIGIVFLGLTIYGAYELWTSDYPVWLKISVTAILAVSIVVALGRDGIRQIASKAKDIMKGLRGKAPPKRVPNPDGRRGGPRHRGTVDEIETRFRDKDWTTASGGSRPEAAVDMPDGTVRFPDLVMEKGTKAIAFQVGDTTQGGLPVWRERPALAALRACGEFAHVFFIRK
jgi:RHS repeat-associated protein